MQSSANRAPAPELPAPSLPTPIRSMTGYALVRAQTTAGELTVSLRTVNHRGLDLHFHLNGQLAPFENAIRGLIKRHIARGHLEIRMNLAQDPESQTIAYNRDLLKRYLGLFQQACEDFGLDGKPDLNTFFSLPGVFDTAREAAILDKTFESEVLDALAHCIHQLNDCREREARELFSSFEEQIGVIEETAARITAIRAEAVPQFLQRLRERLIELLGENISETRLIEEAALLADRSDVHEELTRVEVHALELRRIFENGGDIGKRLDFLLQEMNRETNTILSKTSGIGDSGLIITNLALEIKANIERMREQALNLE